MGRTPVLATSMSSKTLAAFLPAAVVGTVVCVVPVAAPTANPVGGEGVVPNEKPSLEGATSLVVATFPKVKPPGAFSSVPAEVEADATAGNVETVPKVKPPLPMELPPIAALLLVAVVLPPPNVKPPLPIDPPFTPPNVKPLLPIDPTADPPETPPDVPLVTWASVSYPGRTVSQAAHFFLSSPLRTEHTSHFQLFSSTLNTLPQSPPDGASASLDPTLSSASSSSSSKSEPSSSPNSQSMYHTIKSDS